MDKCTQLQLQVRENTEELQDYLKDLVCWEKEMKKQDEEIKKRTHDDQVLPPIRTAHSRPKKKKTKDTKSDSVKGKSAKGKEQEKAKKTERIPGYDYKAWDLFNVDEALKEVDECAEEENKKTSSEEESEDSDTEMYEIEKKKQLALIEKDKGNKFFNKGDYDMAISCYTTGIEHDQYSAVLYANRAMALLKKNQYAAAEADCTQCVLLDPTFVKAYMRRGTSRAKLKKYEEAKEDFTKALELEPGNNKVKSELELLEKEISLSKSKISIDSMENEKAESKTPAVPGTCVGNSTLERTESKSAGNSHPSSGANTNAPVISSSEKRLQTLLKPDDKDSCVIKPIQKPPHLRSQKPMKTIKVRDVSGITELDTVSTSPQQEIMYINDGDNPVATVSSIVEEQADTSGGAVERVIPSTDEELSCSPPVTHTRNVEKATSVSMAVPLLPPVPSTSYQFLGDWKKLKNYPELLYEYIKQFPPEKLPIVFRQSIDTEVFCSILQVLSTKFVENGDDVFLYLSNLRKVGRFDTLVMFLAEEEVSALNQLFKYIRSSQKYSSEEIQNVEKSYNLS